MRVLLINTLRYVGVILLVILAALGPWANGFADITTQIFANACSGICLFVAFCVVVAQRQPLIIPWPAVAALGGIIVCIVQLVPFWPIDSLGMRPAAATLRLSLQDTSDNSKTLARTRDSVAEDQRRESNRVPLTIDEHATKHTLAIILSGLALFLAATWLVNTPNRLTTIAWVFATSGACITLFAVITKATGNEKLYWFISVGYPAGLFGPMVYHNQAGAILSLTMAASGYLLMRLGEQQAAIQSVASERPMDMAKRSEWQFWITPVPLTALTLSILNAGGLLLTLSRGAVVSTVLAGLFTLCILRPRRHLAGGLIFVALISACVVVSIYYFRMSDTVGKRYASVLDTDVLTRDARLQHWNAGMKAGLDYGLLGVGAGAYRHIYPLYEQVDSSKVFRHAHNQYLETWVDTGIPGLFLLAMALLTAGRAIRTLTHRRRASMRAVAAFGWMALITAVLHACVDYTLSIPATAYLFAVSLGAVCGIAHRAVCDSSPPNFKSKKDLKPSRWQFGLTLPPSVALWGAGCLWFGSLWSTYASVHWYRDDIAVWSVPWHSEQSQVDPESLLASVRTLETRLALTDDYRVPLALAELKLTLFRHQAQKQLAVENQKGIQTDDLLWDWTDPTLLLQRSFELQAADRIGQVNEIREDPLVSTILGDAHAALKLASQLSPAIAQTHLRLGELSFLDAVPQWDRRHLHHADRLAPGSADMQHEIAVRFFASGDDQNAWGAWRGSLTLDPKHWFEIYAFVGSHLSPQEINQYLLPDDPELLVNVAQWQYGEPEQAADQQRILKRAEGLQIGRAHV